MAKKIPPPPPIATQDPTFNRWLIELTSILSSGGGINPDEVTGLSDVIAQVGENTAAITTLQHSSSGQSGSILALQNRVTTLEGEVTSLNSSVTTLGARNQVLNGTVAPAVGQGVDGDWYANTSGAAGSRIYVKVAGAWVALA